jgi:hypothetical protein
MTVVSMLSLGQLVVVPERSQLHTVEISVFMQETKHIVMKIWNIDKRNKI